MQKAKEAVSNLADSGGAMFCMRSQSSDQRESLATLARKGEGHLCRACLLSDFPHSRRPVIGRWLRPISCWSGDPGWRLFACTQRLCDSGSQQHFLEASTSAKPLKARPMPRNVSDDPPVARSPNGEVEGREPGKEVKFWDWRLGAVIGC